MPGRPPEDLIEQLRQELDQPTAVLAARYGKAPRTIRDWKTYLRARDGAARLHLRDGQVDGWRAWLSAAAEMQRHHEAARFAVTEAVVEIDAGRPIVIAHPADLHLGSYGTDHERIVEDVDFILSTPGLYAGFVGDEVEYMAAFRNAAAVLDQVITPEDQRKIHRAICRELYLAGKLKWTCWGTHTDQLAEAHGYSYFWEEVAPGVPHLDGQGLIRLRVGETWYTIVIVHKTRFHSIYNKLHGAKQIKRLIVPEADVVATAHYHEGSDIETVEDACFVISGTYKTGHSNLERVFHRPGGYGVPAVVYYPDRKKTIPFKDMRDAARFLGG